MNIQIPIKKNHVRRVILKGTMVSLLGILLNFFYLDIAQFIFPESALKYNVVAYILIGLYIGSFILMVAGPGTIIMALVSRKQWKKLLVITDEGIISDYGPPVKDGIKGVFIPWSDLATFEVKRIYRGTGMVVHMKDNDAFLKTVTDPRVRQNLDKRMAATGGYINLPVDVYDFDLEELKNIFKMHGLTEWP